VDLLAVAPDQSAADRLAEPLLAAGLVHDVIGLTQGRWLERQRGEDPWWLGWLLQAQELLGIETAPFRQLPLNSCSADQCQPLPVRRSGSCGSVR
jgi:hypothetical protein